MDFMSPGVLYAGLFVDASFLPRFLLPPNGPLHTPVLALSSPMVVPLRCPVGVSTSVLPDLQIIAASPIPGVSFRPVPNSSLSFPLPRVCFSCLVKADSECPPLEPPGSQRDHGPSILVGASRGCYSHLPPRSVRSHLHPLIHFDLSPRLS